MDRIQGVLLPIVTPFYNYEIDFKSYKLLINHYINKNIHGLIPLGTTGECPTVSEKEYYRIIEKTLEYAAGRIAVYAGVTSNDTTRVVQKLKTLMEYPLTGLLVTSPYYNRPSQQGLYTHFLRIAEHTHQDIIIYNIPYRTGRNMENRTIYHLAELPNITAIKDSCGNINQSLELLNNPIPGFSILTGEDILFLTNLIHGGQGGILASAHLHTESYVNIFNLVQAGDLKAACREWRKVSRLIPLLFREPNPAPLKYVLSTLGLITSDETREPITGISNALKTALEQEIKKLAVY